MPTIFRLIFSDHINSHTLNRLGHSIETAVNDPHFETLQLLVSSSGAQHDAALNLYGLLRSLPVPVHVHVTGPLVDFAVPAILGAARRTCAPFAQFRFYESVWDFGEEQRLSNIRSALDHLQTNISSAKEIFRRHTELAPESVDALFGADDTIMSADEALASRMIHEITDLNPDGDKEENVRVLAV